MLRVHIAGGVDVLVAESRQVCIVCKVVYLKPPLSEHRSYKRSNKSSNVYEDIEELETGVAFALSNGKSLGTLLCLLFLHIVVELSYNCLKVALEETVTEGYEEECQAG